MAITKILSSVLALAMLPVLIISVLYFQEYYSLISILLALITIGVFLVGFERRKVEGREIVLLALLAAIATVSRIPFAGIPSIQPTTFVIIVTALVFGAESGMLVGITAALVSNLFLGQGPWTPWQMYAWGMIGYLAGMLRHTKFMRSLAGKCTFGAISGFLFGWLMNLWFVASMLTDEFNWASILTYYSAGFYFDLAHAGSNILFIFLFSSAWIKVLERFQVKYGLLKVA